MKKKNSQDKRQTYYRMLITPLVVCLTIFNAVQVAWAEEPGEIIDPTQQEFIEAMKNRAKGRLYDAATVFNNILTNHPVLDRARLELAVTYYRLYDYDLALKLSQEVLDNPQTPPSVKVTVLAFIAQIKKDAELTKPGHTWKPSAVVAGMSDSNVNVGPGSNIINIGDTQFQVNPGSLPVRDEAVILSAAMAHNYSTGKTVHVGQKNAALFWQDNLNLYRRDYFNEHAYDLDVIGFSTGPALIVAKYWRANIAAQVNYLRLGSEELAWFGSVLPSYTKQFDSGTYEVTLDGDYTARNFKRDVDDGRDSDYFAGQLSLGQNLQRARVGLQVGVRIFKESAEDSVFTNTGQDYFASVNWEAWTNGSLYGRVNDTHLDYDGDEPIYNQSRDERMRKYTLGISHTFQWQWLKDVILSGDYVRTENHSNIDLYEYTRDQTTVMLSKRF